MSLAGVPGWAQRSDEHLYLQKRGREVVVGSQERRSGFSRCTCARTYSRSSGQTLSTFSPTTTTTSLWCVKAVADAPWALQYARTLLFTSGVESAMTTSSAVIRRLGVAKRRKKCSFDNLPSSCRPYHAESNSGSTARDHLANERTYLAWLRSSLALVLLGVGVERFSTLRKDLRLSVEEERRSQLLRSPSADADRQLRRSHDLEELHSESDSVLAGALLSTGAATALIGTWRYFATIRLLQEGKFRPNLYGVVTMTAGGSAVFGTVLWARWRTNQAEKQV